MVAKRNGNTTVTIGCITKCLNFKKVNVAAVCTPTGQHRIAKVKYNDAFDVFYMSFC